MSKKVSAYGFDSYNQCYWEEVMPTLRSHGGGDTYPKCFVTKPIKEDKRWTFSMQRIDEYKESRTASTMRARQYKDATDLIVSMWSDD